MNPSSRLHCLGPVFATGTHRDTRNLLQRYRADAHACVRAAVCSQVVTKIDRGAGLLVHRSDEKTERPGARKREREREMRVVPPNDDIPRLPSKFSQLTYFAGVKHGFSNCHLCSWLHYFSPFDTASSFVIVPPLNGIKYGTTKTRTPFRRIRRAIPSWLNLCNAI